MNVNFTPMFVLIPDSEVDFFKKVLEKFGFKIKDMYDDDDFGKIQMATTEAIYKMMNDKNVDRKVELNKMFSALD